ncbi:PREDICTED: uncharacterized protein LOC109227980 [Nicotiana attenuata]|uniref:uncharacterized protein LOC109227980 n=1 Tax=Nicotiana attenuata TaxID=49451 RepID=UPI00090548B0|nr:PREDICTED: uncharacterized protein LOC109227980 [Nicotiana attenuata]
MMKKIEAVCRTFLWTGGTNISKKALLSWDKVCLPKTAGGYNVMDMLTWNKAAVCKLLWNLCKKKDKLWVQWIHLYYGKKQEVWESNPNNASWIVQKIIKAKRHVEAAGVDMKELAEWNFFSIKKWYKGMRGQYPKVSWRGLTCNNLGAPKWIFVLNLALQNRLFTRSRLHAWGITNDISCPLCNEEDETIDHLMFKCRIPGSIWSKLL